MTELPVPPLVDAFWLSTHLRDPGIIVLDATFPLSEDESTGIAFRALHIPGARWLDFRRVSRKRHPVPRWISSAAEIGRALSDLGVHHEMHVVIYDQHGLSMGASRAWWLFHGLMYQPPPEQDGMRSLMPHGRGFRISRWQIRTYSEQNTSAPA
jgi:thiosulfate/3-mercaptopyruvate sulfurtransferase